MGTVRRDALERLHVVMSKIHAGDRLDAVLQAIADGVVEVSGFQIAVINVLQPGDQFEVMALSGGGAELGDMLHTRFSASMVLDRNSRGERWGLFRFLSHAVTSEYLPEGFRALDYTPIDHPDAWHPLDELSVTLHSPAGELIGIVYVDHPAGGLRPGPEVIGLMDMFAVQAGLAINQAQERERLLEQVWLAGMVRSVVAATSGSGNLDQVLDQALGTLRSELSASVAWLDVFPTDDPGATTVGRGSDGAFAVCAALESLGPSLALTSQKRASPIVLDHEEPGDAHSLLTESQRGSLRRALALDGIRSVALVPLGVDDGVAGQLVLMRSQSRAWSRLEQTVLMDVGRELGWALGRARSLRRETLAAQALHQAERDRLEQFDSLASEISAPLATVDSYLHDSGLPADHPARIGMERLWSVFAQVTRLMAFQRPGGLTAPEPIDVGSMLDVQWSHLTELAKENGLRLLPLEAEDGSRAWADSGQLDWLLQVLLEDLLLTSTSGSTVRVSVARHAGRLVVSSQCSGVEDDIPGGSAEPLEEETSGEARWWRSGANLLLERQDGRISARRGPRGRRVVSVSLPMPPVSPR